MAKKETKTVPTVDEIEQFILDAGSDDLTVFGGKQQGGVFCQQNSDEMAPFIHAIMESGEPTSIYLELGAAAGGSAYIINHFLKPTKIILVDDGMHPRAWMRKTILAGIDYTTITGLSHNEDVVLKSQGYAPYDVIFIDADHSYPSVKADILLYLPMLRVGGFMIMHDTIYFGGDVGRVVKELKSDPRVEFIAEYASKKYTPLGTCLFKRIA